VLDSRSQRFRRGECSAEGCYRARTRDQTRFRSAAEVERRYRSRYLPSQLFYFDTARPTDHADIIVPNGEPRQPAWEARTR
jgi:uridine kinase